MEITETVELNKKIRAYDGHNSFVLSLQKQLKTNTKLVKEDFNGKPTKVLSDRQYSVAKSLLDSLLD
jgi:hypothetical protein